MSSRSSLVAGCPVWNEYPLTIARARESCGEFGIPFFTFMGGCGPGRRFKTQSGMRQHGLELAKRHYKAKWYLQLDADERLRNGHSLIDRLAYEGMAYPLPLLQEDGSLLLAPFKLIRTYWAFEAQADYFRDGFGTVFCLSGYVAPPEFRDALLSGPYLEHCPSDRPPHRRLQRLSEEEPWLETRPIDVIHFVLPSLTLERSMMSTEEVTEQEGPLYYCPGCGLKYITPGICTGSTESPHEPIQVENVDTVPATEEDAASIAAEQEHADLQAENESLKAQVAQLEQQLSEAHSTAPIPAPEKPAPLEAQPIEPEAGQEQTRATPAP